ncbi:hypothetical protein K432DRAFT_90598 [Lepidopterella palustris CBS 459.81]|uniref:Uncharacterized protein n=1 Tax=Lepidopterella palustris CBS 459.81 TaxID=1314670 RepID=A0A8E2EJW7_9PEZI|nr:hypothetical protein K432DRAFT_90598 [Lepidopterella palustris CBS 459.81]
MPIPYFHRASPRPEDSPASSSPSRFSAVQCRTRSILNGSSIYSNSPVPSNNNTPKLPLLGFLRRPHSPPDLLVVPDGDLPRDSISSRSPLRPQHTAGSYMRAIAPEEVEPVEPQSAHTRYGSVDPETEHLADLVNDRRRRRRVRRRREPHRRAWVRKRAERGICFPFVQNPAARSKCKACLVSGLFLAVVLTIYLSIALTRSHLGQEVHVLFIMVILCTTIFFCHSLIRLCMLVLHPPSDQPRIPSMTGPEGFTPIRPIRVHLARDEEIAIGGAEGVVDPEKEVTAVTMPPPAYGLWRCSVRVDPNLLHWQRADQVSTGPPGVNRPPSSFPLATAHTHANSRSSSISPTPQPRAEEEQATHGPRPPSYVSDDGVSYVVSAVPRSIAPSEMGMSDVHPAWRPAFAI